MFDTVFIILEIVGTIAFAISGAMTAINRRLDALGVIILWVVTACGGGLLRDTMLGVFPQNLFIDPLYVIISAATSLLLFIVFYIIKDDSLTEKKWYNDLLTITDAVGLGAFVVVGADVTIQRMAECLNGNGFLIVFMATITAVGGGLLRDIFAAKVPNIFCKHIYAVPTIIGAMIYYFLYKAGCNTYLNIGLVACFIIIVRLLAYHYRWKLPIVRFKNHE
ncbi:MAG: trimeric intracellular cation channel family protein [Acholeplasmatales bacterium]|nr:trimeric intracellular cation channel family protein [Acholeplasmatales bacterium]